MPFSLSALIPSEWKLIAGAIAALALLSLLGVAAGVIDKHGHDQAVAELQPKIDAANTKIGLLTAANETDEATIRALHDDQQANDALIAAYADRVTALNQQADDTASAIRKLQNDDTTVDAYLRTPVPAALRGVLLGPAKAGNDAGPVHKDDRVAAPG